MRNWVFNSNAITSLTVLAIVTFLVLAPVFFETGAVSNRETEPSNDRGYYDIRTDKSAMLKMADFRRDASKNAVEVADVRDGFVKGEEQLQKSVPTLKIDYNDDLKIPEVIGTDVKQGPAFLTSHSSNERSKTLIDFLSDNTQLIGLESDQVSQLRVVADYKNPESDLAFVELNQEINRIPVFRGEVKAGFTKDGRMFRVINNLAPAIDPSAISMEFGNASDAVVAAARHIDHKLGAKGIRANRSESDSDFVRFGSGDWAPTAEKMFFPTEPGVAVPAWRVLIWERVSAYYVIVDTSGTLLWRKDITDDQTQPATYNVYANPNAMMNVAESPFPMTPGTATPNGTQGAGISRTLITRVGNEAPYTFNNNGWITDGISITDGNAVEAGLDRDASNGIDVTNGVATGNNRTFDFAINPGIPTNPAQSTGDAPLPSIFDFSPTDVNIATNTIFRTTHGLVHNQAVRFASTGTLPSPLNPNASYFIRISSANEVTLVDGAVTPVAVDFTTQGTGVLTMVWAPSPCNSVAPTMTDYQRAIVTQLFYITNWYHDETYRIGFTEQARNFQQDNFGRPGGSGNDRVSAEAQDCSGTNNANFSTPADGGRGRMQMYLWTSPNPDFDGSLDADIVIHELTHGLSNRLHGNGSGLGGLNMSRAMGEGWSDFYAHAMLSESSDPTNGIYPLSGYATYPRNNFTNYYYGIRRFPKAVMAFTGANGKPHNPLTFDDIDPTKFNVADGAFAPGFAAPSPDGVHAGGEIWSSALWEIRAKYINRLGWEAGNRQILQHVTDGMKLAPLLPTFISERDAIISGVLATGTAADVEDMWAGFAVRGLGASASIQNSGGSDAFGSGTGSTRVTQAFDLPNLELSEFTVSDLTTGNGNGVAEPGELVTFSYTVRNKTGRTATGTTIAYSTTNENLGTVSHNLTLNLEDEFLIPANTACGGLLTLNVQIASSLGPVNFQRSVTIGQPVQTFVQNFDGVAAPAFPAGWTVTSSYAPMTFVTTTTNPDTAPISAFAADLPNCITGVDCPNPNTLGGATDLTSPLIPISAQTATVSFRHRFNTEANFDGGALELSINGGTYQDIITAGGVFLNNGYNSTLGVSNPNPIGGRAGWSGNSGGYQTTTVRLPASVAGQNINLRWRFGADSNTAPAGGGWNVDSITVSGSASCSAINVSVGGRVVDQFGRGIGKSIVVISDGVTVRRMLTNSFGYFSFPDLSSGVQYAMAASAKRYTFKPQLVTPTSNISEIVFAAN